jgi:hypothetical protein
MEPRAVITITENPVGDGIHTQLGLRTEFYPPLEEGQEPSMTHMAAMVAIRAITHIAEQSGGGLEDVKAYETHDGDQPNWWPV